MMTNSVSRLLRSLVISAVAIAAAIAPAPVHAQSAHARVSRDIADRLAKHVDDPANVIVSASDDAIDQLSVRYGVRVTKRLHGGAVLVVTGGQLEALSQDPDVSHIAGDVRVVRMGAEVTAATGADQAWAGVANLAGVTAAFAAARNGV